MPLEQIVYNERFPEAFIGTVVRFKKWEGHIATSVDSDSFELVDHKTGESHRLKIKVVRRLCAI